MMKKVVIIISLAVIILIVLFLGKSIFLNNISGIERQKSISNNSNEEQDNNLFVGNSNYEINNRYDLPSCGTNQKLFSYVPTDLDKIISLTPIGMVSPPDHVFPAPHSYFYIINPETPKNSEVNVYAPSDLVLKQIGIRHYNKIGSAENYIDYTLVFSPCKEFDLYYHHLKSLQFQPFINAANKVIEKCSFTKDRNEDYCSGEVNIPIKKGEIIAKAGDLNAGVYGFDIGARDFRLKRENDFANPSRFCGNGNTFSHCYAVCFADYYTSDITEKFKFSSLSPDGPKRDDLRCGNILSDKIGTVQGFWFFPEENNNWQQSPEENNLYIGPDNSNTPNKIFSVGKTIPNLKPGKYSFTIKENGNINIDPEKTNNSQIFCYNFDQGYNQGSILVQLTSLSNLKVEKVSSCSSMQFTSNAVEFVR